MIDGVVQEIDIKTGKVLFQWNSADHVPYSQSEQPLPASASTPWDWFHINAVHLDTDGNLLIDARDTWTTYKVNRHSGADHLAARRQERSSFNDPGRARPDRSTRPARSSPGSTTPRRSGHGIYTLFDNESAGVANTGADATAEFGLSRAVDGQARPVTPHRDAGQLVQPARGR